MDKEEKPQSSVIQLNLDRIALIITVVIPLWGAIIYGINYEKDIMKKSETDMTVYVTKDEFNSEDYALSRDQAYSDLKGRLERSKILVTIYTLNKDKLSELELIEYEQEKLRLANLIAQEERIQGQN